MTTSRKMYVATCAEVPTLDEDGGLLTRAFERLGASVTPAVWDDPEVPWGDADVVLVRSTWDYVMRREAFVAWAHDVGRQTRLLNSAELIAWNTDKRYLADLEQAGVSIVPTRWLASPGELPEWSDFVVKPSISAGCKDTQRFRADERGEAMTLVERILESGRPAMAQPYVQSVDARGETALLYFGGEYSHAICKGPLLAHGDGLTQGLYRPETITARAATSAEKETAAAALAAVPSEAHTLAYARVDLVQDNNGAPQVLEVELTEPSLFLGHDPGAAERLAEAVLRIAT